jgi:hypothetical protein
VAGSCECSNETLGSGTIELITYLVITVIQSTDHVCFVNLMPLLSHFSIFRVGDSMFL